MTEPSNLETMHAWRGDERRMFPRLACSTKVIVRHTVDDEPIEAQGVNISAGGLRFRSQVQYEVGHKLNVEVEPRTWEGLAAVFEPLKGEVLVRWVQQDAQGFDVAGSFLAVT